MVRTSFKWPPSPWMIMTQTLFLMFQRRSAESCRSHACESWNWQIKLVMQKGCRPCIHMPALYNASLQRGP